MSDKNDLQNAVNKIMQGRRQEAGAILSRLEAKIVDKKLRLQLIDASLSSLDPITDSEKLIELSGEGIKIAEAYGKKDLQAYFMGRKADLLATKLIGPQSDRHNLKLAPGWIEFSTEADKQEYQKLTAEIETLEKEIDNLLAQALKLAEQSGNENVLGHVLQARGGVENSRYLHYKEECIPGNVRARWLKFTFLRYPFFDSFIYTREKARKLRSFVNAYTKSFLEAATIFEKLGEAGAGYAYYNLANNFRTAYRFRKARKFLKMAKNIAYRHNDESLKKQVEMLKEAIKAKNRDIPDYLKGETRENRIE